MDNKRAIERYESLKKERGFVFTSDDKVVDTEYGSELLRDSSRVGFEMIINGKKSRLGFYNKEVDMFDSRMKALIRSAYVEAYLK